VSSVTSHHEQLGGLRPEKATVSPAAGQAADLVDDLFRAHAVTLVRVATLLLGD
jgi:hypothetical protein